MDLQTGIPTKTVPNKNNSSQHHYDQQSSSFQVISYNIKNNDTLFSIFDHLNANSSSIDIEQFLIDFQELNPSADIYQLENNITYLFPIYE